MATFVCIHGAGGRGSYWDLVAAELAPLGHDVVAMDLPCDQEVGLDAYVAAVVDAIGDRRGDLVLVAQSLAGLIAPLVYRRGARRPDGARRRDGPAAGRVGWRVVGQHRPRRRGGRRAAARRLPRDAVHPRRAGRGAGGRGPSPRPDRHAVRGAVAPGRLARRAHPVPALSRRPLLPRRLAARPRAGPAGHRADRDPRRALRLPQPAPGAAPSPSTVAGPSGSPGSAGVRAPRITVRSRMPSVARRALSGRTGKMAASRQVGSMFDQS